MYVLDFLRSRGVWFETLLHRPASSSAKRAGSVHVPGRRVAKAVLIKAGDSFLLVVLPSTSRIDLGQLSEVVGAPPAQVRLATPDELFDIFPDCEPGVVPAFGRLYGLTTLVDLGLAESAEIIVGSQYPPRRTADALPRLPAARRADPCVIHPPAHTPARAVEFARTDRNRRAG